MTRATYALLARLAAPFALLHLLLRGLAKDRWYWRHLEQRLGFGPRVPRPTVWVHAASLGELAAAAPLVKTLAARHADADLLVTTFTAYGLRRARAICGERIDLRYAPLDTPGAVERFLERTRPRVLVVMETELWPNLFAACADRGVPVVLASARLSDRSLRRYARLQPLLRETLARVRAIGARSAADAARYVELGAAPGSVRVVGNTKFDCQSSAEAAAQAREFRARHAAARPVWIAGSTHAGEEEIVLDAHLRIRARRPDALLLLVPRHPPRCPEVAALLRARGLPFVTRSAGAAPDADCAVVLGDTLGELATLYAMADVAFVGGSLVPVGGHNLLEPVSSGVPVVTGRHNDNGEDVLALLCAAGAAQVVRDGASLASAVQGWLDDASSRHAAGAAGRRVVDLNRGAVAALVETIDTLVTSR